MTLKLYPAPKSEFDQLLARLSGGELGDDGTLLPAKLASFLRSNLQQMELMLAPQGALTMPGFMVR